MKPAAQEDVIPATRAMEADTAGVVRVTIVGTVATAVGTATRVYLQRLDGAPMYYREQHDAFVAAFPGKVAVQFFPVAAHLFDQVNKYHLLVFDAAPAGFDLFDNGGEGGRTARPLTPTITRG